MNAARLRLLASRIHQLGPRPLFELLRELDGGAELNATLERYGRLYPLADFIAALDGDQLQPPARLVRAGR